MIRIKVTATARAAWLNDFELDELFKKLKDEVALAPVHMRKNSQINDLINIHQVMPNKDQERDRDKALEYFEYAPDRIKGIMKSIRATLNGFMRLEH